MSWKWYPVEHLDPDEWGIPAADVEGAHLNGFDPAAIEVLTGHRTDDRLQMLLLTRGAASLDLYLWKGDAVALPADHPLTITDWDWNESLTLAAMDVSLELEVEALIVDGDIEVSVVDVSPALSESASDAKAHGRKQARRSSYIATGWPPKRIVARVASRPRRDRPK